MKKLRVKNYSNAKIINQKKLTQRENNTSKKLTQHENNILKKKDLEYSTYHVIINASLFFAIL